MAIKIKTMGGGSIELVPLEHPVMGMWVESSGGVKVFVTISHHEAEKLGPAITRFAVTGSFE